MEDDSVNLRTIIFLGGDPVIGRHILRLVAEYVVILVFVITRDLRSVACRETDFSLRGRRPSRGHKVPVFPLFLGRDLATTTNVRVGVGV